MAELHSILRDFKKSLKHPELSQKVTFMPPIPGTNEIVPLQSIAEIKEMGVALDNCLVGDKLAAYVNRIAIKKDLFLYKFHFNKTFQAVFSIKKVNGKWSIDEFEHGPFPGVTYLLMEMTGEVGQWLRNEQEESSQ